MEERKENEGLASSSNVAVTNANGDFILRLDSDDYLRSNAVEKILHYADYEPMLQDPKVGCMVFLTCYEDGSLVGSHPFNQPTRCSFWDYRVKYKSKGDRAEVFRTAYFKQFPFPQFEGEKAAAEGYVWNNFSDHYDAIYYPIKIYVRDYLPNSLSNIGVGKYMMYPKTYNLCRIDMLHRRLPFLTFLRISISYYRFGRYTGYSFKKLIYDVPVAATILGFFPGIILYQIEKYDKSFVSRIKKVIPYDKYCI